MEVLDPLSFLLVPVVTVLVGWFLLNRFRSLLLERNDDRFMRRLRLWRHVNERLKEKAENLHEEQQTLGDGLDGAARVVGSVHGSLSGLQKAKGMNIESAA